MKSWLEIKKTTQEVLGEEGGQSKVIYVPKEIAKDVLKDLDNLDIGYP